MTTDAETIRKNIKHQRAKAELTQEQVAELLNITRQTYAKYESNPEIISLGAIAELSKIFGCEAREFFLEQN